MEQLVASRIICQDYRRFLAVFLLLAVRLGSQSQASAQQQYNNDTGYVCSDSGMTSCGTFALYRAQESYSTVSQIAELFNTTASAVADQSNLPDTNQMLTIGKAVIIPITCGCGVNSTSFANISYTLVQGDVLYEVNLNKFESLSTTTEIEAVNNINATSEYGLKGGETIVFPLRCACPSNAQSTQGVKSLVTYPVAQGNTVDSIASSFNVSSVDVVNANTGADGSIAMDTTLLIPITSSKPNYSDEAPPPASS